MQHDLQEGNFFTKQEIFYNPQATVHVSDTNLDDQVCSTPLPCVLQKKILIHICTQVTPANSPFEDPENRQFANLYKIVQPPQIPGQSSSHSIKVLGLIESDLKISLHT